MKSLGYVTMFVVTVAITALLSGWVLSVLWGWFIVPVFGFPALTLPAAIGLTVVVQYLTHQYSATTSDKDKSQGEQFFDIVAFAVMKPLTALAFGWIVTFWM